MCFDLSTILIHRGEHDKSNIYVLNQYFLYILYYAFLEEEKIIMYHCSGAVLHWSIGHSTAKHWPNPIYIKLHFISLPCSSLNYQVLKYYIIYKIYGLDAKQLIHCTA